LKKYIHKGTWKLYLAKWRFGFLKKYIEMLEKFFSVDWDSRLLRKIQWGALEGFV